MVVREPLPLPDTCQNTPSNQGGGGSRQNFFPPNQRPGSLTYMGGSIWRPPWIPHLYGEKHLDGPKMAQRRPKTAHDGIIKQLKFIAKNCFFATRGPLEDVLAATWLNMATRWPQDGSRCLQMVPRWPKMAPDDPKTAQDGPKMAPKWPQDGTRWPQNSPRWP